MFTVLKIISTDLNLGRLNELNLTVQSGYSNILVSIQNTRADIREFACVRSKVKVTLMVI